MVSKNATVDCEESKEIKTYGNTPVFFLQCLLTLTIDGRCLWVFVCLRAWCVCAWCVCVRGVCVLRAELRVCIEVPCAFCLCFFFYFFIS